MCSDRLLLSVTPEPNQSAPPRRRRPLTAVYRHVRLSVRQNKDRRADINLFSVARADAALIDALKSAGVSAVEIGEVLPPGKPLIQVV